MDQALRRRRRDALPENTNYADTGCQLFHSCLQCPFERCQYDGGGPSGIERDRRNHALVAASGREGATAGELAAMFGLSRRTVFRVLRSHHRGR